MNHISNGAIARQVVQLPGYFPNCQAISMSSIWSNSSLEILNWMLHVKYVRREYEQCKKLAEQELTRTNGYNEYANFILGSINQENGEIQKALKYFEKCHSLNPQNVENVKRAGRCLFLLGRYELASETFLKAEKLSETPDWNIYYHLGICCIKSQNDDKAKEYLKRAVELSRNEQSFIELAKLYENQKDYSNAVSIYETASRLYPTNTDLSINLGLIFMKLEEYKKAFNLLGTAIAHDPTNPDALFTFAAEIQRHGEYDVAVIKYKIAAQKLPECPEMWNNIGMCFFGKRKYVAAITCLKRSYYLNPTKWLTCYNLGLLHLNTRQYASAAIFLSTAIKLNSQHAQTFTLLALALKNLGDDINCRRCFEEAMKRNGKDVEACINYALFLYTHNDIPLAQKYYSHFQHLLKVVSKIDKELIAIGESLTKVLSTTTKSVELQENINPESTSEISNASHRESHPTEDSKAKLSESKNAPSSTVISEENKLEDDDDLV